MPVLRRFDDLLRRRPGAVTGTAVAAGSLPLLVAVVVLAGERWYPAGDLAQAAMRLESFWGDPPLVGTAGRIGTLEQQGNHPGPAMFWSAWPVWKLLGSSAWAYQVASIVVAIGTYAGAAALATRALGARIGLAVAAAGAVLVRAFGPEVLAEPWNPYAPLLPYLLFVVACWTTATGRVRHLPVAIVAGSFCVQCHVGYAPAVVLGIAVALGGLGLTRRRATEPGVVARAPWLAAAVAAGVVLWLPPVVQELTQEPGNLSILLDTYRDQTGEVIGLRRGIEVFLTQLDPVGNVLRGTDDVRGSVVGGSVLLVVWSVSVVLAVGDRRRRVLALDAVLGAQLVAMAFWSVRLDSVRFPYLVLWFWVVTVLLVVSTVWSTLGRVIAPATSDGPRRLRVAKPAALAVAALGLVGATVSTTVAAADLERPFANLSDTIDAIDDPTAAGLDPASTFRVDWRDGDALGATGFGLMLELERRGFSVGAGPAYRAAVEPHRVLDPGEEDAVLTVVSGEDAIATARAAVAGDDAVRELVVVDARSEADRTRAASLRADAERRLTEAGRGDLVLAMTSSIWVPMGDPSIDDVTYDALWELASLGQPTAVFLSPTTLPPS